MKTLSSLLILAALSSASTIACAARLTESTGNMAMFVTETVDTNGRVFVNAKTGPLVFDGKTYGLGPTSTIKKDAQEFVGRMTPFMPSPVTISYGNCRGQQVSPTNSDVISQATSYLKNNYGQISAPMVAHMKKYGISNATFKYEQAVEVSTGTADANDVESASCQMSEIGTQTRTLTWTFTVDQQSKVTYGKVTTSTDTLTSVHAVYYSKAVAPGLSDDLRYPKAGILSYELLDAQGVSISANKEFDVGGVYDVVVTGNTDTMEESITSEALVLAAATCAANHSSSGCNSAQLQQPDVRSFLDSSGSSLGILDYIKSISPVYIEVGVDADGTTANTIMDWYLYEQNRSLSFPICGYATYANQGNYQIRLEISANRYLINTKGEVALASNATSNYLQPPQSFNLTKKVGPDEWDSITNYILNPLPEGGQLPISDTPGIKQMADVAVYGVKPTSNYYNIDLDNICDVSNRRIITTYCPSGYGMSHDSSGSQICSVPATPATVPGTFNCPDGSFGTATTCYASPLITTTPW